MTRAGELLPGLIVSVLLATAAFMLADQPFVKDTLHLSALLTVILVGMAMRSVMPVPAWAVSRTEHFPG